MITAKTMSRDERVARVQKLIEQFSQDKKFFLSKDFVEAECRSKFIDPLLECLGWDVKNEKGARHDRQEVITEDRVVIDGATKHPDYTLCYGGERKFYVEAKQPSVNLKSDPEPARQVRRYAYTSKMPIAVLTDFQELAIYDTRIKPKATDGAEVARIDYYSYEEYAEKFDELYDKISWAAVDLGKYDSYYEGTKDKRGTAGVDDDILAMIEDWRVQLSEDIALKNGDAIDEFNLTSAVQKIIDRILFLRIAEDKEIEERDTLKKIADSKTEIYSQLKILFASANDKFNAGLFATDKFLDSLIVSDKSLKAIITALYYPVCQYEFSVLPVEILGSIYERFLGKTIRFSRKTKSGHSVQVVEKPEVQKAGGVYYTPSYIVRYIVEQTLGLKLKEAATPENAAMLKVCDPACGSGSFLVGAYQYLLDWHLDYYDTDAHRAAAEKSGAIYKDARSHEYKLSVAEKRRILINSIYGVDIDAQAVEVTKLSLFLKLLENEGKALSSTGQGALFRASDTQKILPDLGGNIKCGNSLVSSDYYADKDMTLFGLEEQRKVNVFDWEKAFPQIFAEDGFDCVIGNPPYVKEYTSRESFEGLHKHPCYQGKMDLWYFFGYKALEISKKDALIGFIAPNNWITNAGAGVFRNLILQNAKLLKFIDFGNYMVFSNASIQTMIYIMQNTTDNDRYKTEYSRLNKSKATAAEAENYLFGIDDNNATRFISKISKADFMDKYILFIDEKINKVLDKIAENKSYLQDDEIAQGIVPNPDVVNSRNISLLGKSTDAKVNDGVFVVDKKKFASPNTNEKKYLKPMFEPYQMERYYVQDETDKLIIYITPNNWNDDAPKLIEHLSRYKKIMEERRENKKGARKFYHLHWFRDEKFFSAGEKILAVRKCDKYPIFAYTEKDAYVMMAINVIKTTRWDNKALTAILNSSVVAFWLRYKGKMQGDNYQVDKEPLLAIPLPSVENNPQITQINADKNICVNLCSSVDKKQTPKQVRGDKGVAQSDTPQPSSYSLLTTLAEQRMAAAQQLSNAKSDADRQMLQQRCDILDSQINAAVYKLYGLTAEEIAVVEANNG